MKDHYCFIAVLSKILAFYELNVANPPACHCKALQIMGSDSCHTDHFLSASTKIVAAVENSKSDYLHQYTGLSPGQFFTIYRY